MTAGFVIDQVSWHLLPGNPETRGHVVRRFWSVADVLQRHGLTTRTLAASADDVGDDFVLHSDDFTPAGLDLMTKVYDRWLRKVDAGLPPDDVTLFEKALARG